MSTKWDIQIYIIFSVGHFWIYWGDKLNRKCSLVKKKANIGPVDFSLNQKPAVLQKVKLWLLSCQLFLNAVKYDFGETDGWYLDWVSVLDCLYIIWSYTTELKFDLHLILYLQTETILEGTTAVSSNNLMQDIGRPCWAFHQRLMRHPALAPCSVAPRRNIKLKSSEARWEPPVYEDLTFSHSLRWPLLGILNHSKHFLLSQKNNIGVPLLLYKQNSKVAFL